MSCLSVLFALHTISLAAPFSPDGFLAREQGVAGLPPDIVAQAQALVNGQFNASLLNPHVKGDLGSFAGTKGEDADFDYIVAGGGTSGIPLAVRLAEGGAKVALVEAGTYYESFSRGGLAPLPSGDILFVGSSPIDQDPFIDWGFIAENQPGANNRPIHFARGITLGGSSALNFMIYQRPTVASLNQWAAEVGDESYNFDNFFPYYKKSTEFTPPNAGTRAANATPQYNADAFTADGGPLGITFANYAQPWSSWMKMAWNAVGMPTAQDFNSGQVMGCQYCTSTIRAEDQARSSSEESFLQWAMQQSWGSNLRVYTETYMRKVLFDDQNNAVGMTVTNTDGINSNFTLHASKEIVLSGGAFHSPQMLMVSGIGPRATLEQYNIPVLSDLPAVGQNMWDHPFFSTTYPTKVDSLTKLARNIGYLLEQTVDYFTLRQGPWTNPVSDFLGWEKLPDRSGFSPDTVAKLAQFPDDWPEMEYCSGNGYTGNFENLFLQQPFDGKDYSSMLTIFIAPLSRGNVTITSDSTMDLPVISPNWLTDPADQEVAIAAFKRVRQAWASDAVQPVLDGPEKWPGAQVQSDEDILNAVKDSLMTLWHPAGTVRMGMNSSDAAIDSKARVFGVNRLRVVDASSFPFLPPGHPQSSCYALAEKIAEDMLNNPVAAGGAGNSTAGNSTRRA